MPEQQFITPIRGVNIYSTTEHGLSIVLRGSVPIPKDLECPRCACKVLRVKAYSVRELKHAKWGGKLVILYVRAPKMCCSRCSRYFMVCIPGVLPRRRATEQFRQDVFHLHHGGLT